MNNIVLLIVTAIFMLPGFVGVLLPILPGIPYMFIVALIFGFIDKFVHLTGAELIILAAIAVASIFVDYLSGLVGARFAGASKKAIFFGFAGLILGMIILPPFGGLLGLFAGVLTAELIFTKNKKHALKAASGGVIGYVSGVAIHTILAIMFLVAFIIFSLK